MKILHGIVLGGSFALVVALGAQSPAAYGSDPNYKVPRLPNGQPDLQGVWGNNSVTPTTRPRQWKDKALLSEQELQEVKQMASRSVDEGGDAIFGNLIQQLLDAK